MHHVNFYVGGFLDFYLLDVSHKVHVTQQTWNICVLMHITILKVIPTATCIELNTRI